MNFLRRHFHSRHWHPAVIDAGAVALAFILPSFIAVAAGPSLTQQITAVPCTIDSTQTGTGISVSVNPACQPAVDRGIVVAPRNGVNSPIQRTAPTLTVPAEGRFLLVPDEPDRLSEGPINYRPAAQALGVPNHRLTGVAGELVTGVFLAIGGIALNHYVAARWVWRTWWRFRRRVMLLMIPLLHHRSHRP